MKTIVVQAGHIAPRDPYHENETGANGEQELVRKIRDQLVRILRQDGRFKAVPMPGLIPRGTVCDAALFLHADGSANPRSSGYSLGYPNWPVNIRLARLVSEEFRTIAGHPPHHRDNYTADMRGYYGFSRVDTAGPEVLVEHGFVSNPSERAWLFAHVEELAQAEYRAILRYFNLSAEKTGKWAFAVEEGNADPTLGKTNYPGLTVSRIAKRLKKGERIILERL